MRKKKLFQYFTKTDILDIIHKAQMIILKYINKDKMIFIINEYILQNKKTQTGILFEVKYKQHGLLSLFFPYNKKYIFNITDDYIITELFHRFFHYLLNNTSDEFEQQFIIEHIEILLNKCHTSKEKLEFLESIKNYFTEEYQLHINSLILLYKL